MQLKGDISQEKAVIILQKQLGLFLKKIQNLSVVESKKNRETNDPQVNKLNETTVNFSEAHEELGDGLILNADESAFKSLR